jgi:RHS repeat-associated protein
LCYDYAYGVQVRYRRSPRRVMTNCHYKFTGKERESESGLDLMGLRFYGSALWRFITPDPESCR